MTYEIGMVFLIAIISYLLGAISFTRVVARIKSPENDIVDTEIQFVDADETMKVGHIGANVVGQTLGAKWGMLVGLMDISKVFLPSLACKLLFPELPYYTLLAGIAGMAGHNWPIYYRFRGGMGFSAAMGSLLAVDWLAVLVLPIAGTLLGMLVRNMVVASLSWLWLLIPWMWWRASDPVYVLYAISLNLLFMLAMIPEIKKAIIYWREGRLDEYGESVLRSNPMGRGMIKMAEKFNLSVREK
ncbi:MAG: glycerol-3-phosphate acyltransferase [Anaerolineales bacterium]|jgi:glycerol-3-phosphate acyltransferase PlsY